MIKRIGISLITLLAVTSVYADKNVADRIDLSGEWEFGYGDVKKYDDVITLPGSMLTNGKGNDVVATTKWTGSLYDMSYYYSDRLAPYREEGNIKFPFFLTPDKEYVGNAYYRKTIDIPKEWGERRVKLHLERPHIETTLTVNGIDVGHQMSLSTPHDYDITEFVSPGNRNVIEIKVYNGIENVCVGQDSHSVTDQTQGNWNGITGEMSLISAPLDVSIGNVRIYPDVKKQKVLAKVIVDGDVKNIREAYAELSAPDEVDYPRFKHSGIKGDTIIFDIDMGDRLSLWSEFNPALYNLSVTINDQNTETSFGMRDIDVSGRDIVLNGTTVYMRGTVENCCFPLTGYPPTDEQSWTEIFEKCREYGINMMRFHSYCPPEAAFAAADKVGVYLQPEGPTWPNHGVKLNSGMAIDTYLLEESKRIVDAYGNHPSFVMMAAGNEPAGDWVEYCNSWVKAMMEYDPTKIYCGASVGGGWAWDNGSQYHVKGGGRGLDWDKRQPGSTDDYSADMELPRNFKPTEEIPVNNSPILAHEQGQWCAFPDLNERSMYTGAYKAKNFEIFEDLLKENGMSGMADKFHHASGMLQTLCYKYEIERNLRTPGYSGFQLLALNDYSGQGTALEGVLNVFWKEKRYTDAEQWRQFCSQVVPLAKFPRFVYKSGETIEVPIEVMNASSGIIKDAGVVYTISDEKGNVLHSQSFAAGNIAVGKNHDAGKVTFPTDGITQPTRLTLKVDVADKGHNSWQFWVYPEEEKKKMPENLYRTDTLDSKAIDVLHKGGNVLLTAAGKVAMGSDIVQHYLPVFWNTSWFKMRPPHTTGAFIDKNHPLFAENLFPTDNWSNLNWWELLNRSQVINMLELPEEYQSPVQPIDTWHLSRKLGMIIEANVLNGKLFMTTMDIDNNLDDRIVAKRMRNAIIDYMESGSFEPSITLEPEIIVNLFTKQTPPVEMYTNESPDELKPKLK